MLQEHLTPLAPLSVLLPSIFLLAAAFMINVVLSRVIMTQREQIGMLKAFGYASSRLAGHYLELTLAIVAGGIVLGLPVGAWLGRGLAVFYGHFFRFPDLVYRVEPTTVLVAGGSATVAATVGVLRTLRGVVAMPPVVAMSPEVPTFRRSLLGQGRLARGVSPATRMVVRNLLRRPIRSALTCAGMALAVAVVVLGESSSDGADRMRDVIYQAQQRADMTLALAHPRRLGTIADFRALPGVRRAEPLRVVPARVLSSGGAQDIELYGLQRDAVLRRVADESYRIVPPPRDGVIVTTWLAHHFGLKRGQPVALEILQGRRRVVVTHVVGTVDEPMGLNAYTGLRSLDRLLGEPQTYSGVDLAVDRRGVTDLDAVLKRAPAVVAVAYRSSSLASYRAMSDAGADAVRRVLILFSIIIAVGVVYNNARIVLAERSRQLATMRVLGFTRGEISRVLLGEIGALALPALPLGFAIGYLLTGVVAAGSSGTRFHMPWLVSPRTYGISLLVFAVAAVGSALLVRRRLDRLDLLAVLKSRE